jgi:UDP-2,3-diacylglucosamine pyrophosphatase LpxH
VVLSDTHIGGSPGQEIFESPAELTTLFDDLARQERPVELVLGGDFFDLLRISDVPDGTNRVALTIHRTEYRALFTAFRRFAAREGHHVIYLPGNHDSEVWWNHDAQATLRAEGLVHEFAYAYAARFAAAPEQIIYCEHGNQFDPANAFSDYDNPLDTPLGDHVVTDVLRRITPHGQITRSLNLRELNNVFPIAMIPQWTISRVFYDLLDRAVTWLIAPIVAAYLIYRGLLLASATPQRKFAYVQRLLVEVGYDGLAILAAFSAFFITTSRMVKRLMALMSDPGAGQLPSTKLSESTNITTLLSGGQTPPMNSELPGRQISIFISGHTHAPSLQKIARVNGTGAIIINSGCWLRQLQAVPSHLNSPPVFVATYVQTHVRVFRNNAGLCAELWAHPKPTTQRLPWIERLAILGRRPLQPSKHARSDIIAAGELLS